VYVSRATAIVGFYSPTNISCSPDNPDIIPDDDFGPENS
jgi:hypothetical protein